MIRTLFKLAGAKWEIYWESQGGDGLPFRLVQGRSKTFIRLVSLIDPMMIRAVTDWPGLMCMPLRGGQSWWL